MGKFMDFMGTPGGGAAVGAAGGLIDNTIGMIGANQRETMQSNRQKEFMNIQQKNQKELNEHGQELAMKTWNDTNYGAQMKHILDAGLNPAMLYGKGGAGGATTNAGSGGGAGSGQAPNQMAPMDIEVGQGAIGGALASSTIEVNKASANKLNADADSIRGTEGTKGWAEIEKLIAETGTEGEKKALVIAQKAVAEAQAGNIAEDTLLKKEQGATEGKKQGLIGAQTSVATQEEILKKYEAGLNALGIQKTDNKVFRYLSKIADDNGWSLQGLIDNMVKKYQE